MKNATAPKTQLRITALVSSQEKKKAARLAKEISNGSLSGLIRKLLIKEYEIYLKAKKAKSSKLSRRPSKLTDLISSSHVATSKPARKRRAGNGATSKTDRRSTKNLAKGRPVIATKGPRRRTGRATK